MWCFCTVNRSDRRKHNHVGTLNVSKLMEGSETHSWVSLGSWKARMGIWLMRFRLSLKTWRVGPRRSRAPSSKALILLLLRYLNRHVQLGHRRITNLNSFCMDFVWEKQKISLRRYLQVSNLKASRKALNSKFGDVIIAQVQGFQRNQLSYPLAINAADLIMMSEKQKSQRTLAVRSAATLLVHLGKSRQAEATQILLSSLSPLRQRQQSTQNKVVSFHHKLPLRAPKQKLAFYKQLQG